MKNKKLIFCYFGRYDSNYSRNRVIIKGLKHNAEIIECKTKNKGLRGYLDLMVKLFRLRGKFDLLIVGYSGYYRGDMIMSKLLTSKPKVWDAFFSIYDTLVFDRKKVKPYSLRAFYYWFLDWFNSYLADKILLDTDEHIKYFSKTFNINRKKFIRVLVGSDSDFFYPRTDPRKEKEKFIIHFHGTYIPLQGVEYIIKAAGILRDYSDIVFRLIGDKGQTYNGIRNLANKMNLVNLEFLPTVKYEDLWKDILIADVCLGIFGNTRKAKRVIPNKVYEAIAMKKPVISGDSPAIREIFTDRENILLCKLADPEDLARKILELKRNEDLRNKIAAGGYELFTKTATPDVIGNKLFLELKKLVKDN